MNTLSQHRSFTSLSGIFWIATASAAFGQGDDRLVGIWAADQGYRSVELLFGSDGCYQIDTKLYDPRSANRLAAGALEQCPGRPLQLHHFQKLFSGFEPNDQLGKSLTWLNQVGQQDLSQGYSPARMSFRLMLSPRLALDGEALASERGPATPPEAHSRVQIVKGGSAQFHGLTHGIQRSR